jgi:hypothetical protein
MGKAFSGFISAPIFGGMLPIPGGMLPIFVRIFSSPPGMVCD